jgi:hypothetical protein
MSSPFVKALQTIRSCKTREQLSAAAKLVALASRHYDDCNLTLRQLKREWDAKLREISA